ncbi:MAG: UDP-N-acetylmuramoyl-tripeptide--D-alanyl-D-alanine ligase [Alphaproteobacteria bacterium]|nr:UDP-N-acetylmuramoyl-tripeptide--D-alanyl-D-alanine ligase [Alphaproteobacteria bacterium]
MKGNPLWSGQDILNAVRGAGPANWHAGGVSIDTRTLKRGDLFVALRGPVHDGHDFVAQAFEAGASAALVHRPPENVPQGAPLVTVGDSFGALQDLASTSRLRCAATVVGITGSVGKTGCKDQLQLMLGACGPAFANESNFTNHWGLPLSLARLPQAARWGVFELGANREGKTAPLAIQLQPHIGLVTNIEPVQMEFYGNIEKIADTKSEVFLGMDARGIAILNRDNPHYARLLAHARTQGLQQILSFGRTKGAEARLISFDPQQGGSVMKASVMGKTVTCRVGTPGMHAVMNALAALLTAHAAGGDLETCAQALAFYRPSAGRGGRQEITLPGGGSFTLIDESFNASPVATRAAIGVLGQTAPGPGGRRIAVLGDMRELGPTAPRLHAELAEPLGGAGADLVFCCGHLMQGLFEALPRRLRGAYTPDSRHLAASMSGLIHGGDVVMVKGAKSMHMEYVVAALRALETQGNAGNAV